MATTRATAVSCGATQLFHLSGVGYPSNLRKILVPTYKFWSARLDDDGAKVYAGETVIFSDRDDYRNARRLVNSIKRWNLGSVVSLSTRNPNTGFLITTYLWAYNGNTVPNPKPRKKQSKKGKR